MEIDKEKQARAVAKAKQSLLQAEIKREEARLNQNVALFLQEKFEVLLNDEFVEKLAEQITRKYRGDQRKTAIDLLERLEKSICSESQAIRERSLIVVMILSEHIYANNIRELSAIIARLAANWLYFEPEFIAGFEPVCHQLQRIAVEMLSTQQWYEVEQLIVTLNKISNKSLLKNNLIYGVVSRVHDRLAEPEVLDIMVNAYLGESSQRKDVVENILLNMGRQGGQFLIQRLTHSNDKEERLALLDLIPRIGGVGIPVLTRYLKENQPWYVTRNIIMIISRLGSDELYNEVRPHLSHPDIRVQQQVVNCIEVLGGDQMEQRLLEALFAISDDLKVHLIDQLVQFRSPEVETSLLELFDRRGEFSGHVSDFLVSKLCSKLAAYPSPRTVNSLLDLAQERRQRYGESDSLFRAATAALRTIEEKTDEIDIEAPFPQQEDGPDRDLFEEELFAQIPADSADPAEMAGSYGDGGLSDIFVETLTDTLTDKRPDSYDQSSDSMFQPHHSQDHHLMVWSGFYELLSTEEANLFFATLNPETFEAGDLIVEQGSGEADLFFVDHGYADFHIGGSTANVNLTPIQAGEIIGGNLFFSQLPWPLTIHAQTELQVRRLARSRRDELQQQVPELLPKLERYCRLNDVVPCLVHRAASGQVEEDAAEVVVRSSSIFRREDGRTIEEDVHGRLAHTLCGGFNLTLPVTHQRNPAAGVGHQISAELIMDDGSLQTRFGIIAGSGYYDSASGSLYIHIKLYHPLQDEHYRCSSIDIM